MHEPILEALLSCAVETRLGERRINSQYQDPSSTPVISVTASRAPSTYNVCNYTRGRFRALCCRKHSISLITELHANFQHNQPCASLHKAMSLRNVYQN